VIQKSKPSKKTLNLLLPEANDILIMKKIVNISDAPKPIAPYSQAVMAGDTLYVSGQIAIDPYSGKLIEGGATEQTKRVMENIRAILKEENMDFANIVKCSIFMSDMSLYKDVNEVYGSYFQTNPPAREAIAAKGLPMGVDVEISCIAAK
jgi:2-iminobutanoate/2-iminopropanoate deaminase